MATSVTLCTNSLAQVPLERRAPTPPIVTSPAWQTWYSQLLARRLAECPLARATSIHFSQAGDDTLGNGSITTPYRTLAKARQIISLIPASGDTALLFRRGDTWRESQGLETTQANITIADYGDGSLPKPVFTPFVSVGLASLWEAAPGLAGVWRRQAGGTVTWVRQTEALAIVLSRQATLLGCAATVGSWNYDPIGGWLYLNPHPVNGNAIDPRDGTTPIFLVRPTLTGVIVRGDGSRVENIVAVGWGMQTFTPSQEHGIDSRVINGNRAVIVGCESYYGSSHAMVHAASGAGGGITTFVDCKAGLCQFNGSANETIFNTFSFLGGSETIFESCVAVAGTLPSSEWNSLTESRGIGFYGHAGGLVSGIDRYLSLVVTNNCSSLPGPLACNTTSTFGDIMPAATLADVRCFIINEYHPGDPRNIWSVIPANQGTVRMNSRYLNQRLINSQIQISWGQSGWFINNQVDFIVPPRGGWVSIFYSLPNKPCPVKFIGNHLKFTTTSAGTDFRLDFLEPNSSAGSVFVNNIFSHTGPGVARLNMGAVGDEIISNAFFGFNLSGSPGDSTRWLRNITLTSEPPFGVVPGPASPLLFAARSSAAGNVLAGDAAGIVSSFGFRSSIGPLEGTGLADRDGDGRLSVEDLYAYSMNPTDVNGSGAVTEADRAIVNSAARFAETVLPPNGR